ncbi:MAG: UDP-N-acetylglucosamine 2-epimerase [Actinomycetota bacterium]|nr:UDP-N-acetylglucosamine 2-epimerase [Actinomycetota bacterium]
MRNVCVVVGSRANYSSIKSAMRAVEAHPDLRLQLVVGASALLDRYGTVLEVIEADGFVPDEKVFMLIEGETPSTMAKSTGLGLLELPTAFERLQPDVVITVGDRFETMATALAATYMNIPLAHTMGGEVSGNIDESIRHAVTKFAHVHFPACTDAADRIIRMGEDPERVHVVGCPRMDLVAEVLAGPGDGLSELFREGVGGTFDLDQPFVIVSQHPVTTEYGDGKRQITETLKAVQQVGLPAVVLWPNADAGSEHIASGIRTFREHEDDSKLHFFKNLPTTDYVRLMRKTACLVGNSSSAIREGSFIGTPAVNIGGRQDGRQRGSNVVDVGYERGEIADAIRAQLDHGPYEHEPIYGDGRAGERIADVLAGNEFSIVKRMTY